MSATFNWSIKPGVTNRYGFVVNASAEDVRPSNCAYVGLWGNDITGNGSRKYPYRTILAVHNANSGLTPIVGSGVYRGDFNAFSGYADGDVIIDNTILNPSSAGRFNGFKMLDGGAMSLFSVTSYSDIKSAVSITMSSANAVKFCILNAPTITESSSLPTLLVTGYNTFLNASNFVFTGNTSAYYYASNCYFSIYYNCKISFINKPVIIDYSLFYNCQFRLGNTGAFTAISDLATLLAFIKASYPDYPGLTHCKFGDPKFNNPAIGDYTLAFDSPAKNMSYSGTFVGAKSIAQSIKASATESTGGFEFSSAINLTIGDDSITLDDTSIHAQIDTKPIINILGRELAGLPSYGFNADRNGQYIDSIADKSETTYAAGDILPASMPFIVENGALIYNSAIYNAGDRGTTAAVATTFSTVAGAVMREILEAPQRHTVMARFSDGGGVIANGDTVTEGYYYMVSGTLDYGDITYNDGAIFKAIDTNPVTGVGSAMVIFSTEEFQHYEPGIKPTSNNVGDIRTGTIVRGNGDPAYDRGGIGVKEFPINAKFIQLRYIIKPNNLKP